MLILHDHVPDVIDMAKNNHVTIFLHIQHTKFNPQRDSDSLVPTECVSLHTLQRHGAFWHSLRSCPKSWLFPMNLYIFSDSDFRAHAPQMLARQGLSTSSASSFPSADRSPQTT